MPTKSKCNTACHRGQTRFPYNTSREHFVHSAPIIPQDNVVSREEISDHNIHMRLVPLYSQLKLGRFRRFNHWAICQLDGGTRPLRSECVSSDKFSTNEHCNPAILLQKTKVRWGWIGFVAHKPCTPSGRDPVGMQPGDARQGS